MSRNSLRQMEQNLSAQTAETSKGLKCLDNLDSRGQPQRQKMKRDTVFVDSVERCAGAKGK